MTEINLSDVLNEYLCFNTMRAASIKNYRAAVRYFLSSQAVNASDISVARITPEHIAAWRDELLNERGLSATSYNNYRKHVSVVLNYAVKRGYIPANPFLLVRPAKVGQRLPKRIELSTLDRALLLLRAEDELPGIRQRKSLTPEWYYAAMLRILFFTGMRRSQLVGLEWRDVDFERRRLLLRMETSKASRDHVIPMFEQIVDDFLRLRKEQLNVRLRIREHDQVFDRCAHEYRPRRGKDTRIRLYDINNFFKSLSSKIGTTVSPHRLRHTAATELASVVMDVRLIQDLLGHASPATTMVYIRSTANSLTEVWNQRLARGGISRNVDKVAQVRQTDSAHQRSNATVLT